MRIEAFRALRPETDKADVVAAVPYDTVSSDEARALIANEPCSFLRVTRPEADLPPGTDVTSDGVYERGAENFARLIDEGVLVRESAPCLYVYRQVMGEHAQRGVVACCHIEDVEKGSIKGHEGTRENKLNDRVKHVRRLGANTGPVFMTYRDEPAIDVLVSAVEETAPLFDFVSHFGISHTVWRVEDGDGLVAALRRVPVCYVADGHHRAAAAVRAGDEQREGNPSHKGSEEYNWFLACLLPASQLQIMAYNRCVSDLNGMGRAAFVDRVREHFRVMADGESVPREAHQVGMYLDGTWYSLRWDVGPGIDTVLSLDVAYIQERLLGPILGIEDPLRDDRIEFVGGIRGTAELVRMVDAGEAAVAFSMYPVTVEQMMSVADSGRLLPPKSTWFEPKLKSGLLIHTW